MKDRIEDAYNSYASTRAESANAEGDIQEQFNLMHAQIIHEQNNAKSWKDMFTHKTLRYRCFVGFATMFAGQATATQVINSKL